MADARRLLSSLLLILSLGGIPSQAQEPLPSMPPEEEGATQPESTPPITPESAGTQAPPPGARRRPPGTVVPPAPSPVNPDAIQFQLKFPAEQGGGSAGGSSLDLEYVRDNYAVLSGEVRIKYQDIDLQADRAEIDLLTKIVTAEGNVILDQGPRRMSGRTMEFDLDTKTGSLTEATAHVAPDYYFSGAKIAKIDDDVYTVDDGMFTSCSQEVPDWSFRLGTARVEIDKYAHVRNASLRARKLPVFYTPYILWPVKSDRSSGLLIPNIGYSERRGASLGLAYYQVLGRSYDTTIHTDLYSKNILGLGNELRYRPTEGTRGTLLGYAVRDPKAVDFGDDEWRWKVEWSHVTTDLPLGMRGVVNVQEFSDFNFFRDFERDFDRNTLRFIDSRAFVTGNWGAQSLNVLLNQRETFVGNVFSDATVDQRKLPEIEYRLRSTRLGRTPLYMQFQGSASYLGLDRPDSYEGSYGRVDLFPQLTLPVRTFPWLSLAITGGSRATWYSDSLNGSELVPGNAFAGESLNRILPYGNAQIVGPSFSRVFDREIGNFARFKHVIEPRFVYNYLGDIEAEEQNDTPQFDEIDSIFSTNNGRMALINRVLAKPKGPRGVAREIFLFELSRRYSFDSLRPLQTDGVDSTQGGPLEALMRFNPSDDTSVKLEASYNTLFSGLDSTGLTGSLGFRRNDSIGLTWYTRYAPQTGDSISDQIRLFGGLTIWPQKLRIEAQINYDLQESLLQQQRYILNWTEQCYSFRLEMRDFRSGTETRLQDRDFRFSLTLRNVGTFLDLTSRSSSVIEP